MSTSPAHFRTTDSERHIAGRVTFAVGVAILAAAVAALTLTKPWETDNPALPFSGAMATEDTVVDEPSPKSDFVSAWLPYWDDGAGLTSLRTNGEQLTELHPFWFEAQSATSIVTQGNASFRQSTLAAAKSSGAEIVPTITETMKADAFLLILQDDSQRAAHVDAVCSLATDNDFAGIDVDYETFALNVNPTTVGPLRSGYATFITELATCLHEANKRLEVTMLPRTDDAQFAPYLTSLAPGVFDYRAIGAAADIVRPMAYDHTTPLTAAGSTDPIEWVRAVAEYTKKQVPARKVVLGLAVYGYDWTNTGAKAISARAAMGLAAMQKVTPDLDATSQSRVFDYTKDGVSHQVWFDTSEDTRKRAAIAKELRLAGVSYWALGNEERTFWTN